jgi:hypothetical protein
VTTRCPLAAGQALTAGFGSRSLTTPLLGATTTAAPAAPGTIAPPFSAPFRSTSDPFRKTGSGQTSGRKLMEKLAAFAQRVAEPGRLGSGRHAARLPAQPGGVQRPGELKLSFCAILCIKTIILPRQARDKHRENSKNVTCVTSGHGCHRLLIQRCAHAHAHARTHGIT